MVDARSRNFTTAVLLFGTAAGMLGLAYASVPLYRLFCQVTGYGGTTQVAVRAPGAVAGSAISVRFDANAASRVRGRVETLAEPAQLTMRAVGVVSKIWQVKSRAAFDTLNDLQENYRLQGFAQKWHRRPVYDTEAPAP